MKIAILFGGHQSKALDVCEGCFAFQPVVLGDLVHGDLQDAEAGDDGDRFHAAVLQHRIKSLPKYVRAPGNEARP